MKRKQVIFTTRQRIIAAVAMLLFMSVSLLFLAIGVWEFYTTLGFIRVAKTADGVVISRRQSISSSHGSSFYLTVRFTPISNSRPKISETTVAYGSAFAPKIGDQISVYYDPGDLNHIAWHNMFMLWVVPIFFPLVGGLLLFLTTSSFVKILRNEIGR